MLRGNTLYSDLIVVTASSARHTVEVTQRKIFRKTIMTNVNIWQIFRIGTVRYAEGL